MVVVVVVVVVERTRVHLPTPPPYSPSPVAHCHTNVEVQPEYEDSVAQQVDNHECYEYLPLQAFYEHWSVFHEYRSHGVPYAHHAQDYQ